MKKEVIYAYRVKVDNGNAPCVHDLAGNLTGLLSLAVCKGGKLRNGSISFEGLRYEIGTEFKNKLNDTDVYLLGIYKNSLLYFAKLSKIVEYKEYFAVSSCYKGRQDDFFDFDGDKFVYISENGGHDVNQQRRDKAGKYVLLSESFAYFGKKCIPLDSDLLEILPTNRERKIYRNDSDNVNFNKVWNFMKKTWDFKEIIQDNEPNDDLDCPCEDE